MTELRNESSHINPRLSPGCCYLSSLSLSMSFCLYCCCLSLFFVIFSLLAYVFTCHSPSNISCPTPIYPIADISRPHLIVLVSVCRALTLMCNRLRLDPERVQLTSTGGKCRSDLCSYKSLSQFRAGPISSSCAACSPLPESLSPAFCCRLPGHLHFFLNLQETYQTCSMREIITFIGNLQNI